MTGLDGPTLRAVRENLDVPLRRIARQAGMSHGHLSKVERGEHGRPVTPAILAAYERVTGVRLSEAAATVARPAGYGTGRAGTVTLTRRGKTWRPGQLTDLRRRSYNAAVAAVAVGGQLGEPVSRLLDATGRPTTPQAPDETDVVQLEQLATLVTAGDLRFGGGWSSQLAKVLLRWAAPLLEAAGAADPPVATRLYAGIGTLAQRAGWACFDIDAHEAARSLFRLALATAAAAAAPNLRAHLLADVAAQHNHLGYHDDALELIRLGEGDERITPAVRAVLHGVKARAYAATGDRHACLHHIERAAEAHGLADTETGDWLGDLAHPAHLHAATGHALATLAASTGTEADRDRAVPRLTQAIHSLEATTHTRALALCTARLATVHLTSGDLDQGTHWAHYTLHHATGLHSARVHHAIATIRATATRCHPEEPAIQELVTRIDDPAAAHHPGRDDRDGRSGDGGEGHRDAED